MRVCSRVLWVLVASLAVAGCAKNMDTRVAGTDDEAIDSASARLEELGAHGAEDDASCQDRCDVATRTCGVAEELCALVDRNPDRDDLPPRCARGREQCSDARSGCVSCQNG
ncbi:hypothetical protein LZ198_07005 [Myxococcus sp. K15C18031901]|uniref:hypothetical protein n=1 Tax=Myxococcus dinghuensis TaxID=2906761 RepID=UPI0020A72E92|nr:hypothetical protein [Myxococcus dinghuensis]MCP3098623.1 hypothetical protein [Myxococcus dinghuensis]